jgi:3-oxoacyl-[acyl-carrier protein] reductase
MIDKKVMVVTGSRKGIGRQIAEIYVNKGYLVIGCSRGPAEYSNEFYVHYELDVADEVKVKSFFRDIRRIYGRLDVLINNAGVASMNHSLLTPISTVRSILETNVVGTFLFSREAAKVMKKNKFGRIINFVTFAIPFKLEGEAIYAASKAAVVSLTEILAREYAEFGVTVNAVAPPAVKTDLIRGVAADKLDNLLERQSIKKFGAPSDVCNVIDFFISKNSEMINGEVIYVGGI